jgi:hypothetical protein
MHTVRCVRVVEEQREALASDGGPCREQDQGFERTHPTVFEVREQHRLVGLDEHVDVELG